MKIIPFGLVILFILFTGCAAPLSVINNDDPIMNNDGPSLPNEVLNVTVTYALGGVTIIPLPQSGGNYSIHAETINKGYVATLGYQYSTESHKDRFGNDDPLVVHGWTSPTTPDGYLGYSNEYSVIDNIFTIPPNPHESILVVFCKSNEQTIAIMQTCGTRISILRLS